MLNITVINGSPKGEYSITLQTVRYLENRHPKHSFTVIDAGKKIRKYEKDFSEAKEALNRADLILFCYPVYTFIVPSQLHRFIELIMENGVDLSGKYASQISTSKHFYDVTAHRFIEDNCRDLGMKVIRGLSADMEDLTKKQGQKDAEAFFRHLLWYIRRDKQKTAATQKTGTKAKDSCDYTVCIVADLAPGDTALSEMIDLFIREIPGKTKLVNIHEFPFKGGCISCFSCAAKGECIYTDGFEQLLREEIQTCDAIVPAFTIKDHSMGYRFKLYDDRQFCNGHRTVTRGKPFGYIVNGKLSREENLKMIIEARAQVGGNCLAAIACNETCMPESISDLAAELDYAIRHKYTRPANFYGVGGMKIFRDLIWQMQGLMKADHKFYKEHGQYDFPQKHRAAMWAMYLVGAMMSNDRLKKKMGNKLYEGMLMPYKKALSESR